MSIINDAIKKARREFQVKNKKPAHAITKEDALPEPKAVSEASELKWSAVVVASLVLIVSLLGSMFLYKHMSRSLTPYNLPIGRAHEEIPITLNNISQEPSSPTAKLEGVIELNGIVYGAEDKWAIINNRIRREGDAVLGGKVSFIAKDFVKIGYDNGKEVVLNLR
jgi:hypothetical protein